MKQKFNSIRWVFSLLVISFLFCPICIWAQGSKAKAYPRETLAARVIKISKDYKVNIMYNPGQEDIFVPKLTVNDNDINKVLDKTLVSTDFTYKKTAGTSYVIVKRETTQKSQQPTKTGKGSLSGSVVDERGEPITGATVVIKGTNLATMTDTDGKFSFRDLTEGAKTITVSFISFETLEVNNVEIDSGKTTALNVAMKAVTKGLGEVVVTADYGKASVSGLYARQKNSVSATNGITAEQISRTPDNNAAQVLSRISGLQVSDDKNVVVRGLSDRYNNVQLNGVLLPSTDPNRRDFAFDIIPSAILDNITVNKTASPDMTGEFAGGLVQVNTKDIPDNNFVQLTIGTGYDTRSTGKEMLGMDRGGKCMARLYFRHP